MEFEQVLRHHGAAAACDPIEVAYGGGGVVAALAEVGPEYAEAWRTKRRLPAVRVMDMVFSLCWTGLRVVTRGAKARWRGWIFVFEDRSLTVAAR